MSISTFFDSKIARRLACAGLTVILTTHALALSAEQSSQALSSQTISDKDFEQVYTDWINSDRPYSIQRQLFDQYTKAHQLSILGQYLWLAQNDYSKSTDFFMAALNANQQNPGSLSVFDLGYAHDALGRIFEHEQAYVQASQHFQKATEVGYGGACISHGVMFERIEKFEEARGVYERCPDAIKEQEYLLHHNLGTLYYNGLGGPKDVIKGASHWQKAYALFRYDSDVNYNMGIYHFYQLKDYQGARFHFAACALTDMDCVTALRNPLLVKATHYADDAYLTEILSSNGTERQRLLEDRLKHWLDEPRYFDDASTELTFRHNPLDAESSSKPSEDTGITRIWVTGAADKAEKAVYLLNRLIYVDMFSSINSQLLGFDYSNHDDQVVTFRHLGQQHRLEYSGGKVIYEVVFSETVSQR